MRKRLFVGSGMSTADRIPMKVSTSHTKVHCLIITTDRITSSVRRRISMRITLMIMSIGEALEEGDEFFFF